MHFEWSCALKATLLMLGGTLGFSAVVFGLSWLVDAWRDRARNLTGGAASNVGRGLVLLFMGACCLVMVSIIWYSCYEAVCPMAHMPHKTEAHK